jgi:hypothetical protein
MTDVDRLKAALEEVVTAAIERVVVNGDAFVYYAEWLYIVDSVGSGTASLRATDPRLPDLVDIPLWQGTGGALAVPAVGSQVRVRFLNADRTKPIVAGLDTNTPTSVAIAGGGPAVGRVGDSIGLDPNGPGQISGSVSGATCTITAAQIVTAMMIISGGSSKVTSG